MKRLKMDDSSNEIVVGRPNEYDFGFAFNDPDYSDRVLRLEIVPNETINSTETIDNRKRKASGSCDGDKVVTLHISSPILAAKSNFFTRLFKNGMKESQQKSDVSLTISESEEATMMDLFHFMYGKELSATLALDLIGLLVAADKFEVTSCMRYCVEMLLNLPMSLEYALSLLELPSSVLVSEIVHPLIEQARKYVVAHFKDFTRFKEEAKDLPLSAVEVVLGSEGLRVGSEDDVFDFVLDWALARYPELEERREILTKHLVKLVCFPNMSSFKLKEVLASTEFDHEQVSKLVMEALFSKLELPCGRHVHPSKDPLKTDISFSRRVYRPRCVIYYNLMKEKLVSLFPTRAFNSSEFGLGGKRLFLLAKCCKNEQQQQQHLGLFLHTVRGSESCTLDYEFAALRKSSKEFEIVLTRKNRTVGVGDMGWGSKDLLGISWEDFMSDDCDYFVDGVLHVRVEITLANESY